MPMPHSRAVAVLASAAALALPTAAAASITEYPLPAGQSGAEGITTGPDGALWFPEAGSGLGAGSGMIGRITTSGVRSAFPIPSPGSIPLGITTGPDGALWFTEELGRIGRITTSGAVTELPVPGVGVRPIGIASGSDGTLWFTAADNAYGRVTTGGAFSLFRIPTDCCGPSGITAGLDGALWLTETLVDFHGEIERVATNGTITRFPIPTTPSQPAGITVGPDGALWFADPGGNSIGRVTTAGSFTRFRIRTPASGPTAIVTGPDGALWFTEQQVNKVGRMTTNGSFTDWRIRPPGGGLGGIARGPDGALWFTENTQIGRITTDQPMEDSVDGTLFTEAPCPQFELGCTKPRYIFGTSSDASGGGAFGSLDYVTGERAGVFQDHGTVTCLAVHGNRATAGVNFEFPPNAANLQSQSALIFLEDNGPVDSDRFAVEPLPGATAPSNCPAAPPPGLTLGPAYPAVAGGDGPGIAIVDAKAVPTTKAECRHGGWRRFGFRNQGRCIAYVIRHSRRPGP
jgi:virginiamycin B lyase